MLRETFSIIGRNWSMYAVVVVGTMALSIFDELSGKTTSSGATSFMWGYLAMCVQGAVIYSGSFTQVGKCAGFGKTFPYFLKTAALFIAALVISLPIFTLLPSELGVSATVLVFTSAAMIVYVLLLSLVGTWPVSSVTGRGTSLFDAFRRGVARFFPTFARLIAGIILPLVVSMLIFVMASQVASSPLLLVDGRPNILMLAVLAIAAFLQALGVSYAAVVLARVYLAGEQGSAKFGAAAA